MNPSKNDENKKKPLFQSEPLCLFCFPDEVSSIQPVSKTYVGVLPKKEPIPLSKSEKWKRSKDGSFQKPDYGRFKTKEEKWLKKRTEARIIRRRMKEPMRNLKSFLLTSVNYELVPPKAVPSLFEVLETVKDAWPPPPPRRNLSLYRQEDQKFLGQDKMILSNTKMKEEIYLQFPSPLVNRRFSMPEELMRKYSIMREKTSDDSETIKTMDEITSTSSTFEETARRKLVKVQPAIDKSEALVDIKKVEAQGERKADACQQTMEESNLVLNQSKRVTQTDFYSKGEGIIRVREKLDTFTRTSDKATSTTLSAKEETDESGTTESVPSSSSPIQLPKHESLSDNLSSESDNVHCTCRELTSSKETSTDVFHSGKSTLSQTVSDKSFSTQDSTVSVKSVSTRGSTASDNSNTTTPEREKTSAKESTTSDYSPRSNMNRKNRRRERCLNEVHKKSCPKYHEAKHSRDNQYKRQGSAHFNPTGDEIDNRKSCGTITDFNMPKTQESITKTNNIINTLDIHLPDSVEKGEQESNLFTWAKLSQDELYMMQQLRHQKLLESRYSMSAMMPVTTPDSNDNDNRFFISSEGDETGNLEQSILIPRYSALPRTLSMLVNTSSADNSIMNSDSDNQSLADSLEDQPTNYVHKLYFDTKNESKPVRGAVHVVQETRQKDRTQKGRAFFVSFKDPFGEEKLPEGIEKIPQPPERIKNQILKRHLNLQKHTHIQQSKGEQKLSLQKKRTKSIKNENVEKVFSNKKTHKKEEKEDIYKKIGSKEQKKLVKRQEIDREKLKKREAEEKEHKKQIKSSENENEKKNEKSKKDFKEHKTRFVSKIPVLVSSRSTPSPERELEDIPKQSGSEEDFSKVMESTQILEIAQTSKGITLQKHQNFFSTPQKLIDNVRLEDKNYLSIPPLPSAVRMQSPFHPTLNRQALLSQTKRSPVSKYRQRFEVIPEEKSSSLSSAEEKTAIETLPKFTTTATSPLPTKNEKPSEVEVQSYKLTEIPEVFVAQIEDKQLRTLPFLKRNDEQKIILLSSQTENSNSSKGRDALIAMNCEDFKRLAKGWTNFYKLSENSENSDFEDKKGKENTKKNLKKHQKSLSNDGNSKVAKSDSNGNFLKDIANKRNGGPDEKSHHQAPQKEQQANSISEEMSKKKNSEIEDIDENIRLHSSNTILRTVKTISPSNSTKISTKKQISLPDLKAYPEKNIEPESQKSKSSIYPLPNVLPEISEDDTDTDSTDYMEPPSPRVPPLSLEDYPSDAATSSSENELDELKPPAVNNLFKSYQLKKRGVTNKTRLKKDFFETTRFGKKKNSGWSVTVARTVELSRSTPDLEMRLSFLMNGGPPVVCQSDSGFAEDSNYSKMNGSLQDLKVCSSRRGTPLKMGNTKHKWTVMVENPNEGGAQDAAKEKSFRNHNQLLPNLEPMQNRNTKKVLKKGNNEKWLREAISRKLYAIWPKVQKLIQKEFVTDNFRLTTDFSEDTDEDCLLCVKGTAILLETKEKPLTMTERDVTKRYSSRASD